MTCRTLEDFYHIDRHAFEKQYKEVLSGYREWDQLSHAEGAKMMRFLMKKKGVDSLETLRQQAIDNGVEFIACQMSMDVMGVKHEELLDEVSVGGVATYMERAEQANVNLFI